jgi:hypothetical protein
MSRSVLVLGAAATAAVALSAVYLALGGASYAPAAVADPCAPRAWTSPTGIEETLFQVALSTADGAACDLGVSREELVLALADDSDLDELARAHDISRRDAEDAVRQGLLRAVRDAQRADAIGGSTAGTLRFAAEHLPMRIVLALLRGTSSLLPG